MGGNDDAVRVMQVLRLVYCLVNHGYYGNADSLQSLLEPLMNIVDGSRDLPFPIDPRRPNYSFVIYGKRDLPLK